MKISYNWLRSYADFTESPEELSVMLTGSGLEVESLEHFETLKGGLRGVVVGHVLSCMPHPDADRLTLTRVDVGAGDPLPIVCGAPNVAPGQKVLVATVGATLHTANGSFEIKKAKIRGQESMGMICAEDELGLGDSHDGIMVLPGDAPVGMPAGEFFKVEEDWVFEIGLTPNRIDAASHLGVARDIVAVVNQQKGRQELQLKRPDISAFSVDNNDLHIPVIIEDETACPRYCGITISGVKVTDSPQWLQNRLKAIGLKPINNVVDITNFVLHELGQPLHAFDADTITGNKVVVRKPAKDTPFVTLDEEELKLTGNDLMICNAEEGMCMAGVLGGVHSGVDHETKNVFLESAYFDPVTIRKSARHHGLNTDASFRFERGADPGMAPVALKRAAMLIREIAGGRISSEVVDEYPLKMEPRVVDVRFDRINQLIGNPVPREAVMGMLRDLEVEVLELTEEGMRLSIPLYRVDVTREADIVEEILRIYGYNTVELPGRLYSSIVLSPKPDKESLQNQVSDMLSARGFHEIMNNSLTRAAYFESWGFSADASVKILNPLSQDLNVLRQSLLFGGLETIAYNQNRKVSDMRLYEFGNVYLRDASQTSTRNALPGYAERMMLSLLVTGRQQPETWNVAERPTDFFDLKSALIAVLRRMGLEERRLEMNDDGNEPLYQYQLQFSASNKVIATLGALSPKLLKAFDIRQEVFYAEVEWQTLVEFTSNQKLLYREIPKFPEVRRDLALLIDAGVSFAQIEKLAFQTGKKLLKAVRLFDVYQDQRLGQGKKSYAVSFTLQDEGKTLTDKEIDKFMQKMAYTLEKEVGAEIRK
jgi:phenylalanyl-tRNA synthetase beta chain